MRIKTSLLLIIPIAMALAQGSPAKAHPDRGWPEGSIGMFLDPSGINWCGFALPGVSYDMFVVAFDLDGDLFGFEFSVVNPIGPFILSRQTNPETALDVGPGDDNWIVGIGSCKPGQGAVWLVREQFLLFAPQDDLFFCVRPAEPSSPGLGGKPGWLACDESLHSFVPAVHGLDYHPDWCAIVNDTYGPSCPVATESASWGAIKARFTER